MIFILYCGCVLGLCVQCDNFTVLNDAKWITPYVPFISLYLFFNSLIQSIKNKHNASFKHYLRTHQKSTVILSCYASTVADKQTKKKFISVFQSTVQAVLNHMNDEELPKAKVIQKQTDEINEKMDQIKDVMNHGLIKASKLNSVPDFKAIYSPRAIRPGLQIRKGYHILLPKVSINNRSSQIVYAKVFPQDVVSYVISNLEEDKKDLIHVSGLDIFEKERFAAIEEYRLAIFLRSIDELEKTYIDLKYENAKDSIEVFRKIRRMQYSADLLAQNSLFEDDLRRKRSIRYIKTFTLRRSSSNIFHTALSLFDICRLVHTVDNSSGLPIIYEKNNL